MPTVAIRAKSDVHEEWKELVFKYVGYKRPFKTANDLLKEMIKEFRENRIRPRFG